MVGKSFKIDLGGFLEKVSGLFEKGQEMTFLSNAHYI